MKVARKPAVSLGEEPTVAMPSALCGRVPAGGCRSVLGLRRRIAPASRAAEDIPARRDSENICT